MFNRGGHVGEGGCGYTARLFLGAGAPLDPSYGGCSLNSIKEGAIARRNALLEDDPEVDFDDPVQKQAWAIDTAPSSAAAEDITTLHLYGAPKKDYRDYGKFFWRLVT